MSISETDVARHYSVGDLGQRILDGLTAAGKDLDNVTIEDLAVVDEFHIGGRKATEHAISKLSLTKSQRVLDVGCGIGGAARAIAAHTGCHVTGVDLTPEFIEAAGTLTQLTGMEQKLSFKVASALDMPFENGSFNAAITFHVAMNIADRPSLYAEIARVLTPGALLCAYDVMKRGDEPIRFPVPWSETAQTSHLTTPEEMEGLLTNAGFEVLETEDRTEFADNYFRERLAAVKKDGPSPLGPHIIMGDTAREKFQNMQINIESGRISPVQMIARRKAG